MCGYLKPLYVEGGKQYTIWSEAIQEFIVYLKPEHIFLVVK